MKNGAIARVGVWKCLNWRHCHERPTRDVTMEKMADMANHLLRNADETELKLAPFFAVGCPGVIDNAGAIQKGARNLPATGRIAASISRRRSPGACRAFAAMRRSS
ncbi:MAG: hypothetical protein KIS73_23370 [Enhydrobacter sp.]|nr:hypothetical protein [Enhydrobacter sp.]